MSETMRRDFLLTVGAAALAAQRSQAADTIKLAIIGTGHRGWEHLEPIKLIPHFEIVAIADPTPNFSTTEPPWPRKQRPIRTTAKC